MRVLGVDPGSRVTGYGLIEKGSGGIVCVDWGQVRPPPDMPFYERIHHIFLSMIEIIRHHSPQEMAIEDIFHAKNAKSSLKLGHARGAILVAAVHCGLKVFEYSPLEIKKALVGYGRGSKEQVRRMVQLMLNLKALPGLDTSDALATAICHASWKRYETSPLKDAAASVMPSEKP
jgi:crossover junction endodeoxyribonuclease RuvC